ncbi:MAG TPA: CHAT domain-containing protein [Polyangiaceae bacterium]|nr:CHAT domain-containing protein [Polyangiaceae bacterium]
MNTVDLPRSDCNEAPDSARTPLEDAPAPRPPGEAAAAEPSRNVAPCPADGDAPPPRSVAPCPADGDAPPPRSVAARRPRPAVPPEPRPDAAPGPRSDPAPETPVDWATWQASKAGRGAARRRRIKILFLAANALPERPLRLEDELRAVEARLRTSRYGDTFELARCSATRLEDVQRCLLEHAPDVVHFAGHGDAGAGLVLFDDRGKPARVPIAALAALLRVFRSEVRLIVFNACFSAEQAAAVRESVGVAVGMRGEIADRASLAFAGAFYEALGYGRSVREAFELGVGAVKALDLGQGHVPELFAPEGAAASDPFVRVPQPRRPLPPVSLARRLLLACAAAVAATLVADRTTDVWLRPAALRRALRPPSVGGERGTARAAGAPDVGCVRSALRPRSNDARRHHRRPTPPRPGAPD